LGLSRSLPCGCGIGYLGQMLFSPRISKKELALFCRRLATSLEAGVDVRKVLAREAQRSTGLFPSRRMAHVSEAVNQGSSLSAALRDLGSYYPELFHELVAMGDQTGHLAEVFDELAEHYHEQVRMRRAFISSITWPMAQLVLAICVVGLLIWVMGIISDMHDQRIDILGLGLIGTEGLKIYFTFIGLLVAGVAFFLHAASRGVLWTRPLQRMILRVPALGPALRTLVLARIAWSLHLTLDTGMPVRRALAISLRSAGNARYSGQIRQMVERVDAGGTIYEAFLDAGGYPIEFLDALHVGEQTGRIVESMETLARQYRERARSALATITTLAGFAVWCIVAVIIVALIFRIFMFYLGQINQAMGP
jgi:type II secretory pathway component PulF